jgi:AraC-like DNA-binding protein
MVDSDDNAVRLPAEPLRPFVARYAGFASDFTEPAGTVHAGLPSRHVHLIVGLSGPIDIVRMPSARQRPAAFTALVGGLQDAPALLRQESRFAGIHVFLTPCGVRSILGVPSAEIAGRVVELADIWGGAAAELVDRLKAARAWERRFAILDEVLARELRAIAPPRAAVWAWDRLVRTHGRIPIQRLAGELGFSRRHLGERFRNELGVTPKAAARILRFEHACRTIMDERPSLAEAAVTCGYQDQAHMTREWHALAGCTPGAWIANELPFLQDYEVAGRDDHGVDRRGMP